jgi:hypothetical protein
MQTHAVLLRVVTYVSWCLCAPSIGLTPHQMPDREGIGPAAGNRQGYEQDSGALQQLELPNGLTAQLVGQLLDEDPLLGLLEPPLGSDPLPELPEPTEAFQAFLAELAG